MTDNEDLEDWEAAFQGKIKKAYTLELILMGHPLLRKNREPYYIRFSVVPNNTMQEISDTLNKAMKREVKERGYFLLNQGKSDEKKIHIDVEDLGLDTEFLDGRKIAYKELNLKVGDKFHFYYGNIQEWYHEITYVKETEKEVLFPYPLIRECDGILPSQFFYLEEEEDLTNYDFNQDILDRLHEIRQYYGAAFMKLVDEFAEEFYPNVTVALYDSLLATKYIVVQYMSVGCEGEHMRGHLDKFYYTADMHCFIHKMFIRMVKEEPEAAAERIPDIFQYIDSIVETIIGFGYFLKNRKNRGKFVDLDEYAHDCRERIPFWRKEILDTLEEYLKK